ncbi:MAG TPA: MFS transporter [Bryobacteraceae bacterium]|nr:MFS transporter [Bryobacteraceae bacterium]
MLSPASSRLEAAGESPKRDPSSGRLSLFAFFLSGISVSFLGAILLAWRYHLGEGFTEAGNHFLSLAAGFVLSIGVAHVLMSRKGAKFVLVVANAVTCAGFLFLAFSSPPAPARWRFAGLLWIGVGAGLLNTAMFQVAAPFYQRDRAAINIAGVLFGSGCVVTALLVAGTYYVYTVPSILILLALIPGFSAGLYAKSRLDAGGVQRGVEFFQLWREFRNPAMALFGLLLFFQFGNEWSLAGWLPLFLTRRLGISPETSLLILALYWAALMVGRILSQLVMGRLKGGALLLGSILSALLGTIVLASTNNRFGAVMGVLFVGAGYASVYPLVVQKIGHRFPEYRPGLYNSLFSVAITGGLLAPWSLGFFANAWGIQAVMILPALGTCMVFVLVLLILLESKLSSLAEPKESGS